MTGYVEYSKRAVAKTGKSVEKKKMQNLNQYLHASEYVDYTHPRVQKTVKELSNGQNDEDVITKICFEFVRDEIRHSGDSKDEIITCKASEVLEHKTGWCYSKAILLAALLRANNIPTAFCYQRLSCSEYKDGAYCLHGLNAVYLKKYGWYKIDARGNKEGVDAQFTPPIEKLAFVPQENEYEIDELYTDPLPEVIEALQTNNCYRKMVANFPDIKA